MAQIPTITLADGSKMPMVGLGTWQLEGPMCTRTVKWALDLGYTHIDTAEIYANHEEVGEAIADAPREGLFITTKAWWSKLHYEEVLQSCDEALQQLGLDYIDLYLVHWPNRTIPMEQTFRALKRLHDDGKVRAVGVSNFTTRHLEEAIATSEVPIVVNQVEFHPFLYQRELLEFCKRHRIQLVAYSPLAQGLVAKDDVIKRIAQRHGRTPAQVSLRWILDKGVPVIPKASNKKHLQENLDVDFTLSPEETELLDNLPQQRINTPGMAEFE